MQRYKTGLTFIAIAAGVGGFLSSSVTRASSVAHPAREQSVIEVLQRAPRLRAGRASDHTTHAARLAAFQVFRRGRI